jgi:dTDP-4-dehydrorhamnose 3,5-epimerase
MLVDDILIPGCRRVTAFRADDARGSLTKIFSSEQIGPHLLGEVFVTASDQGALRGMHLQEPPHEHHKLVFCLVGEAHDVLVDVRRGSPTQGLVYECSLSPQSGTALWIPPGVAHGFLALTDGTVMLYCTTSAHRPGYDCGVRWDSIDAHWPSHPRVVSRRDEDLPPLDHYATPFDFA